MAAMLDLCCGSKAVKMVELKLETRRFAIHFGEKMPRRFVASSICFSYLIVELCIIFISIYVYFYAYLGGISGYGHRNSSKIRAL